VYQVEHSAMKVLICFASIILLLSLASGQHSKSKSLQTEIRAVAPPAITYWQLYASADGETHFKKVIVTLTQTQAAPPAPPYAESAPLTASTIRFAVFPANWGVSDRDHNIFHNASGRRFISVLHGVAWIKASDGETRQFQAGDILEVLDIAPAKGHITWVGDQPYSVLFSDHP